MRSEIVQETVKVLEEFNFNILLYMHSCFDIAAQKKDLTLLIKVLDNVDSFRSEHAGELKRLSGSLSACPVIVGSFTKAYSMKDGVLYERHDVPAITITTLRSAFEGAFPKQVYSKGRMIAEIDGSALKELRSKKGMTAEELADAVRLTKESIYLYESDKMRVRSEVADKIQSLLQSDLVVEQKIFEKPASEKQLPSSEIGKKLMLLDFDVDSFKKMDFDLLAKDPEYKVVIKSELTAHPDKIINFSDFFKSFFAFVSEKESELPVIHKSELKEISCKKDFLSLLKEKAKH